jgi:hypothetical protein
MANGDRYYEETGLPEEPKPKRGTEGFKHHPTVWRPTYGWAPRESYEKHTSKAHIRSQQKGEQKEDDIWKDEGTEGWEKVGAEYGILFDLGNNIFDIASQRGTRGLYAQKSACSLCGGAIQSGVFNTDSIMQQELCQKCDSSGIGLMPF